MLLTLPPAAIKTALVTMLHAAPPPLPPSALLYQLHLINVEQHGLTLKALISATEVQRPSSDSDRQDRTETDETAPKMTKLTKVLQNGRNRAEADRNSRC